MILDKLKLPAVLIAVIASSTARADVVLEHVWTHDAGGNARAEIVAFDAASQQLFVVNGAQRCVMRLDIRDGREIGRFDVSNWGDPTSVAVNRSLVAVAVVSSRKTDPGHVLLFSTAPNARPAADPLDGKPSAAAPLAVLRVGPLPDMLVFTPDGGHILVANEGEPSDDYAIDPEGSISVIDVRPGAERAIALTADFVSFNSRRTELERQGVRLTAPNRAAPSSRASVTQDLEPEYIAVAPDGKTAWVTLQENNALAEVNVLSARVTRIVGLGLKDHSRPNAGFDASDRDNGIHIERWPVSGWYQPDGIFAFAAAGELYLATANEGDVRAYAGFTDEARVAELRLDSALTRNDSELTQEARLGRLKVSRVGGDTDGDGDIDRLLAFGARSLAIWNADGQLVYDSGDVLERFIAAKMTKRFNTDAESKDSIDNRSPVRGPEPEGVVVGRVGDATYAFVGMERTSAVAIFDVTRPRATRLVNIVALDGVVGAAGGLPATARNIAPEGLVFIPAGQSPLSEPLLAVACEVSGTTVLFRIRPTK